MNCPDPSAWGNPPKPKSALNALNALNAPKASSNGLVRQLQFMHQGYQVTALSMELATTGRAKHYQAGFTMTGHAGDLQLNQANEVKVFDTHVRALRYARLDAKRFISALIGSKTPC